MGDISQGRDLRGYQSPEDRRLSALEADLAALRAEVDRHAAAAEVRAQAQEEAYRRMMEAISGTLKAGGDT